jgi:hypothetical protein
MIQPAVSERPGAPMRSPDRVMRLARLGAMHQTRLSFLRIMLRRVERERWRFDVPVFTFDAAGSGHAVLRAVTPTHTYSLVAFAQDLPPEMRTDRVIATAWDSSYALFDGMPTGEDIARLEANVPRQEAGRYRDTELVLARANKSVRLFDSVVEALSEGCQPDAGALRATGYLMRTTAVYGNGKFGIADRDRIADRPEFIAPFQAEMLTVWLIRWFTVLYAEEMARQRVPGRAVRLGPALRRELGVGNSTGLGMAPFVARHPALIHAWFATRETALARVLSREEVTDAQWADFLAATARARATVDTWHTDDAEQAARIGVLSQELGKLEAALPSLAGHGAWRRIIGFCEGLSLEMQELAVSLVMEPNGDLVDDLETCLCADEARDFSIDARMSLLVMKSLIETHYGWTNEIDFSRPEANARFWYVSEEKLEPRLGERREEPGADLEQPLAIARDVRALADALAGLDEGTPVAALLMARPDLRHVVRRVQIIARHPYGEVRDNLIDTAMRPIDLLRAKLAFFGALQFDPRSDRWLRINLFRGEVFPDEMRP